MALFVASFCCMPGGVIALLLTQSAKSLAAKGDQSGAEGKLRLSMLISGASIVLGLLFGVLYIALVVVSEM